VNGHRCLADDHAAIRNVIGLTALLGDEGAPEDYRRVYAAGATWQLGDAVQRGADEIVAAAAARRAEGVSGPGSGTRHLVLPMTIEVAGDTARAISYYAFLAGTAVAASGSYRDELARTGPERGWQITGRQVIPG
jgi:hypothetical protein